MLVELTQDFQSHLADLPLGLLAGAIGQQVMPHLEVAADAQRRGAALRQDVAGVLLFHAADLDGVEVQRLGLVLDAQPVALHPVGQIQQRGRLDVLDGRFLDVSLRSLKDACMGDSHQLVAGDPADAADVEVSVGEAQRGEMADAHAVRSAAQAGFALGAAVVALCGGFADVCFGIWCDEFQLDLHSSFLSW